MSNDPTEYGPRLYAYLEAFWRANNTTANAWCDQHPGIHGPTLHRWRNGAEPKLSGCRAVADALGVSLVDLLLASGVIRKDETEGRDPVHFAPPSLDAALKHDESVSPRLRGILRDMVKQYREAEIALSEVAGPRKLGRRGEG